MQIGVDAINNCPGLSGEKIMAFPYRMDHTLFIKQEFRSCAFRTARPEHNKESTLAVTLKMAISLHLYVPRSLLFWPLRVIWYEWSRHQHYGGAIITVLTSDKWAGEVLRDLLWHNDILRGDIMWIWSQAMSPLVYVAVVTIIHSFPVYESHTYCTRTRVPCPAISTEIWIPSLAVNHMITFYVTGQRPSRLQYQPFQAL